MLCSSPVFSLATARCRELISVIVICRVDRPPPDLLSHWRMGTRMIKRLSEDHTAVRSLFSQVGSFAYYLTSGKGQNVCLKSLLGWMWGLRQKDPKFQDIHWLRLSWFKTNKNKHTKETVSPVFRMPAQNYLGMFIFLGSLSGYLALRVNAQSTESWREVFYNRIMLWGLWGAGRKQTPYPFGFTGRACKLNWLESRRKGPHVSCHELKVQAEEVKLRNWCDV